MNQFWLDFLGSQYALFSEDASVGIPFSKPDDNALYPIAHLGILKVTGTDAAQFLQGQLTCNIKELTEKNSFFAGFCNAKGRVISTMLILKQEQMFLLILPTELQEKVKNQLQRYVLRSKVKLELDNNEFCLSGLTCTRAMATEMALPEVNFSRHKHFLKLPNYHYLLISPVAEAIAQWSALQNQGVKIQTTQNWQYHDVNAGLAWLDADSSEQFIPQMLNLDKLGGISLTKGCYTGQEVVARTHYLGKAKRELFLAQVQPDVEFAEDNSIIDKTGQVVGQIIHFQADEHGYKILLVLQTSALDEATELTLNNRKKDKINLVPFVTV